MTNYLVKTVDEFILASPEVAQPHLQEITAAVRSAIPYADEKIGYGKPYYKYHGWVTGMDVYKNHIGLEIWDGLSEDEREMLEGMGYKTGSRTFQVRFDQKVPTTVIKRLVTAQAKLNELKAESKKK